MPDTPEYVATPHGATPAGAPVYRVVTDGLQVIYVAAPYKASDAATIDATICHALAALRAPIRPVR